MDIQILQTDYAGKRRNLFWLALKTSALTVLTLGIYRFWMKTRLRRFYWSAIRPGGIPLEYTGTGVEKLMGFLIAVVFLAFYIGIFNLILMFLSYSLLSNNFAAYAMSFVGLIPFYFYAQYRARRYILGRTRWRGLRFGIDAAAWPYAWRAMLHWLLTFLTLGVLLPRQIFWLEKFRIDRTWFGRERFVQEGRWVMLLPAALHMYFGIFISMVALIGGYFEPMVLYLLILGVPWMIVGFVHFRIKSFRLMAAEKRLGERVVFEASPRTWRVLRIYVFGNILVWLSLVAVVFAVIFGGVMLLSIISPVLITDDFPENLMKRGSGVEPLAITLAVLLYFSFFILWGVLSQIFVTLPLMCHYAETVVVKNSHHLGAIQQRPRDEFTEAEGFAEALDIGAAI